MFLGGVWGHVRSVLGDVWEYFWEVIGGVLEAFVWYFGRCSEGKSKGKIIEKRRITNMM